MRARARNGARESLTEPPSPFAGEKSHKTTRSCKAYNCSKTKVNPCVPKPLVALASRGGGVRGGGLSAALLAAGEDAGEDAE